MSLEQDPMSMKEEARRPLLYVPSNGAENPDNRGLFKAALNLRVLLVIAISALVLAGTLGVSMLHSIAFTNYAQNEALHRMNDAAEAIAVKTEHLLEPASIIAQHVLNQETRDIRAMSEEDRHEQFARFLDAMDIVPALHPQIFGTYLGYPDGSSVNLTRNSSELLELAGLPSEITSPYLRLEHDASDPDAKDVWAHEVDGEWKAIAVPTMGFDPRTRPWYRIAADHKKPVWTGLYRFLVDGFGITLAAGLRNANGNLAAVLGVDIRLDDLSGFIRELDVSPNSFAFIARPNGELIAHPVLGSATLDPDVEKDAPTLFEVKRADRHDVRLFEVSASEDADIVQFVVGGETILGRRLPLADHFDLDASLFIGAPLSDFTSSAEAVKRSTLWVVAATILAVIAVGILIARAVAHPVKRAADTMTAIARLDLSTPPPTKRSALAEIQTLNDAVMTMRTALASFVRYVPGDLVRNLLDLQQPLELGGTRREITVLFTDIEGFTQLTETEQHERMIDGLADYFDIISDTIAEHGGTLDKFIGDAVMAFWGAPRDDGDHTRHACEAVLDIKRRLDAFNQQRMASGELPLKTRFALHRGYAFVGNVGARDRFGYTALGDVVNTAARLEGAAKELGVYAVVSREVAANAGERHRFIPRGEIQLRGKAVPIEAFEFDLEPSSSSTLPLELVG